MKRPPGRPWWADEPRRLTLETAAMVVAAPELRWDGTLLSYRGRPCGGWRGRVPLWPFDRPQPFRLAELVRPEQRQVEIRCAEAHPMVVPTIRPTGIRLPDAALGWHDWHLTLTGGLCLLQEATAWRPGDPVAQLVPKISGWLVEFGLIQRGLISAMTEYGIQADLTLDPILFEEFG
jgi:hypothetical protein